MKRIIIFTAIFLSIGCCAQKKPIPQKPTTISIPKIKNKPACGNSEMEFKKNDTWYNEKYSGGSNDFKKYKSVATVKKLYHIKSGTLFYKKKKTDSLRVFYRKNENTDYILYIIKGKPTGYTINANNNPYPSMYSVSYNTEGNTNYHFIEQNVFLPKGNGTLKNYYYSEWIGENQKFSPEILKEEGEIKDNLKFGEWKYYSKDGKIDSSKTYTLKDSVDVRFPHCIFNTNEPCY